jgi:NADPH-dependent 2,4-dienoyl-CoA reductase/sulfur reductase-like enzyme
MSRETCDLAIIGAGPAGMAAAIVARRQGLSCIVFDEQNSPGGQIYRAVTQPARIEDKAVLGPDYYAGRLLADAFLASGADYRPSALVWLLEPRMLAWTSTSSGGEVEARMVLAATGAMERPFPVKRWTLPGVMTAGAAQILLKASAMVEDDAVFVGCGPLLYLVAAQYVRAGMRIRALLDTTERANRLRALPHLPRALAAPSYLAKGLGLLRELRRASIPIMRDVEQVEILGDDVVAGISWRGRQGRGEMQCRRVLLHQGVIPNVNLTMAAGCRHVWDDRQCCWRPDIDGFGATSVPWLRVAGDGAGIRGAKAAALAGEIAALGVACELGSLSRAARDAAASPLLAAIRRDAAIRPFLETLYRPRDAFRSPSDDSVIICRCEEVSRGEIAAAIAEGCMGPNQLKAFTRCGMGPCQGRLCGHTVSETFADLTQRPVSEVGYFRIRMPIKPVTLGDIAGVETTSAN